MKQFINDIKDYGFQITWFNLRFNFCYWLLNATDMKVTTEKLEKQKKFNAKKVKI